MHHARRPKLEGFTGVIDAILETDRVEPLRDVLNGSLCGRCPCGRVVPAPGPVVRLLRQR